MADGKGDTQAGPAAEGGDWSAVMLSPGFILAIAGSLVLVALAAWTAAAALRGGRANSKIRALDKHWRPVAVPAGAPRPA